MGITTSYVGQFLIEPPLNPAETAYLTTFAETRHSDAVEGSFFLPGNPIAAAPPSGGLRDVSPAIARTGPDRVAWDRPSYWCPWSPCLDGHCLGWNNLECTTPGESWLRYVIDTFLRPGAGGRRDRSGALDGFTFDHMVSGVVAGSPIDTLEVFTLTARANVVRSRRLMAPPFPEARLGWLEPAEDFARRDPDGAWAAWQAAVAADAAIESSAT